MNSVHCTTEQRSGSRHRITVRAHELHADLGVDDGGQDSAPGAHDYFDASLAACKALTAVWYARKNGMPLERVDVEVERDATEERKGRYRLIVHIALDGPLTDEQRARIYSAAAKCPVTKLMTTVEVVIETAPLEPAPAP
jgi:putative redox protein